MSAQQISVDEVNGMTADELREAENLPQNVSAEQISFPSYRHHMKVREKLEVLADQGVVSPDSVEQIYEGWLSSR